MRIIAADNPTHTNAYESPEKTLSKEHEHELLIESVISPDFVAARGYYTASRRSDVPDVFPEWQRRLGLVIPTYSPAPEVRGYQLKPQKPITRKSGKGPKYETPYGSRTTLDVNPLMLSKVADTSTPLWVTEGVKKGDALASRGECAISIIGVWNWQRQGEPLPCWQHVALDGREVFVVFDSDVMVKPEVQLALEKLATNLEERGAGVNIVYLPEVAHG